MENIIIDLWYGDKVEDVTAANWSFYSNGEYRGNLYKDGKIIGDYVAKGWEVLEKAFPQLNFNWG